MRVLLEAHRLARTQNLGGIDSYWRQLIPRLLKAKGADYTLLTAFLNPRHLATLESYRRHGTSMRHWWMTPEWLNALNRCGLSMDGFMGEQDILHLPEARRVGRTQARVVVTAHDLMFLHRPQFLKAEWVEQLHQATHELAQRATFWICVSDFTRDELVRHYGVPRGRTRTIYHGVDASFRAASQNEGAIQTTRSKLKVSDAPYFLFVGSVEPKKNLPTLLEAYGAACHSAHPPEANLLIAGRAGWGVQEIDGIVARFPKMRDRLRFLGFVDQSDLAPLLAGARAMVLPSRYEGFGMPVLESMAAGTPVLTTTCASLPEIAGGAAKLFDPDDSDALRELLLKTDGDKKLRDELRDRGFKRAQPYTWELCAEQTLAAYGECLQLDR